jgi:hypothetical protein
MPYVRSWTGHDRVLAGIHVHESVVCSSLVAPPIHATVVLDDDVVLEAEQQVIEGYEPVAEELPPHPVVLAVVLEQADAFLV